MPSIRNAEDRSKLPKWAQQQVEALLRDLADRNAELAAGPENSDTFVSGGHVTPDRPLGTGPTINFGLEEMTFATGQKHTQHILEARWVAREETLELFAYGGGLLNVIPWSTNHIKVRLSDR